MSENIGSAAGHEENLDTAGLGERRRRREAERAAERARAGERPLTRREIRARDEAIASGALQLGDAAARHGQTGPVPASSPVTPEPVGPVHSAASQVGSAVAPPGSATTAPGSVAEQNRPGSAAAPPGQGRAPGSAAVATDEEGRPLTRRQLRERAARAEAERQARLEADRAREAAAREPAPQERPSYSSVQALQSGPLGTPVPARPASAHSAQSAAEPAPSARPTRSAHSAAAPASVQSAPQPVADDDTESTQAFLPRWRSVADSGPIARPGGVTGSADAAGGPARRTVSSLASTSAASVPSAAAPSNPTAGAAGWDEAATGGAVSAPQHSGAATDAARPGSPPRRVSFRDAEPIDPAERRAEAAPERTLRRPVVRPETGEIHRGQDPTASIARAEQTPRRRSVYTASVPRTDGEEEVPLAETTSPVHWHSTVSGAIVTADVTPTGAPVPTPGSPDEAEPSPSSHDDTGPMPPATLDAVVAGEGDDTGEQFLARPEWASVASVGSAATGALPTVGAAGGRRRASAHSVASAATEAEATSSISESDHHEDEPSPRWLVVLQWLVVLAVAVVLGMLVWYVATGGLSGEDQALATTRFWRIT